MVMNDTKATTVHNDTRGYDGTTNKEEYGTVRMTRRYEWYEVYDGTKWYEKTTTVINEWKSTTVRNRKEVYDGIKLRRNHVHGKTESPVD